MSESAEFAAGTQEPALELRGLRHTFDPGGPTVVITTAIAGLYAGLWFVLPLVRRGQRE